MAKLHQNIRTLRTLKGWNQETMAELLELAPKSYASIEQGKTDIQLSRLEQIAKLLEVEVADLFNFDKDSILKLSVHHSKSYTYNQQLALLNSSCTTATNFEHELDKAKLLIEQKDKEIDYLKELIARLANKQE